MSCRTSRSAVLVALVALVAWCSCGVGERHGGPGGTVPAITTAAEFTAHGSVGQAYVEGARPGQQLVLADAANRQVAAGVADELGSLLVRDVPPRGDYTFRAVAGSTVAGSPPFAVTALADTPAPGFYAAQELKEGLNYLTMRDGVSLAATVRLPPGRSLADGPFPTVIEYSGYAIAAPHDALEALIHPDEAEKDPLVPATSTAVGSVIAPLLGYVTVSLQMRGSGCSGGAMGLFDLPTTADGYDAVEIAAAQPWVKDHRVGMVGISFSGMSQLFVAGARPPHLAAIAPLSVTDDLYATGRPGGIYNSGFAAGWMADRMRDARPAPAGGQAWARAQIEAGDERCRANQRLRLQTPDMVALVKDTPGRDPALYDDRTPARWAARARVPVFLVGALQDEQTGGQWPSMIPALGNNPDVWVTMVNGTHIDSLGPATISRWIEFLDLFVAGRVPAERPILATLGSQLYEQVAHAPAQAIPPVRFTDAPSVEAARDAFRRDPRVRVLLDNGASASVPGSLGPRWEEGFGAWPPPAAAATRYHLGDAGVLAPDRPARASTVSFRPDPGARPPTSLAEGNAWDALPPYTWAPVTGDAGVGFITAALPADLTVIGPASLDLWLRSSAEDTDLQATVSEVRPDGQELYVQSGYLRASARALDRHRSTELQPVPTFLGADRRPLPAGGPTLVRVPLLPVAYAFRAGSRIRVTVSAPGGDRPSWRFDTPATGGQVTDTLSLGGKTASSLVLPVIAGVSPTDPQPACPSLRGQPCRAYVPAGNQG